MDERIFNEQARRRENIEVSIGELGKDVGELKGQFSELLTGPFENLKSIQVTIEIISAHSANLRGSIHLDLACGRLRAGGKTWLAGFCPLSVAVSALFRYGVSCLKR